MTLDIQEATKLVKEGAALTHKERIQLADERLHTLVDYAREHSPYLAEKYKDLPAVYSLADLPIVEKKEVTANFDRYVTDPEVTLAGVEAFCASEHREGVRYLDKYTVLHTSGTTGKPLYTVRDEHRNNIHGMLMQLRLMQGIDPACLDIKTKKSAAVIFAERGAPDTLSAYGSVLSLLALEKEKGNLHIAPKAIFTSSEMLPSESHLLVESAFGCPVKNNYCMTEGGEIAMTWDGPDLLLNEDFILVEPVDADKNPVADPDAWSDGILVTDLTNFVQPIIRYYVNDRVKIERIADDQVRLPVLQIQGRTNEVFTLCGQPFTTAGIDSIAELYPGVLDFQFVQVADNELQVRAVLLKDMDETNVFEGLCRTLEEYFHTHGCPDAVISYSFDPIIKKKRGGKASRYADLRAGE